MNKTFSLGAVLSVTTARLICSFHELYAILKHITGQSIMTHVIPRALRFGRPLLYGEFPELGMGEACMSNLERWLEADKTPDKSEFAKMWLAEVRMLNPTIKREYEVPSFEDQWLSMDPLEELAQMVPPERIIAVV